MWWSFVSEIQGHDFYKKAEFTIKTEKSKPSESLLPDPFK